MSILSNPSVVVRSALIYVTAGTLTVIWSAIWFFYLRDNPPAESATFFWCYGFLLTGMALLIIGLTIGRIGRSSRHAELPPQEVVHKVIHAEQTAACVAPVVAEVTAKAPFRVPNLREDPIGALADPSRSEMLT
jgi:hypothetical protein